MLSLYRSLLALRRAEPALAVGSYAPLDVPPPLLGYLRQHQQRQLGVLLNLSGKPQPGAVPAALRAARVSLSTHPQRAGAPLGADLLADEGVVVAL
jgi:alpha-glucosidase